MASGVALALGSNCASSAAPLAGQLRDINSRLAAIEAKIGGVRSVLPPRPHAAAGACWHACWLHVTGARRVLCSTVPVAVDAMARAERLSVAELSAKVDELVAATPLKERPLVVGIAGVPGGGKTTVVSALMQSFAAVSSPPPNLETTTTTTALFGATCKILDQRTPLPGRRTARVTWPRCRWVRLSTKFTRSSPSTVPPTAAYAPAHHSAPPPPLPSQTGFT